MDDTKEPLSQEELDKIAQIEEEREALSEVINGMAGKYYSLTYPKKGPDLYLSTNPNNKYRTIVSRQILQKIEAFTIHPGKNHWDPNFVDCLFIFNTGVMKINLNLLEFLDELEGSYHEISEHSWITYLDSFNTIIKEYMPENKDS